MKLKQTNLSQKVTALLDQADALTVSMKAVRQDIASTVIGLDWADAWDLVARDVLPPIAKKYKVKIEKTRTGSYKLVDSNGARADTAYSFMRTLLSATNLVAGAGDTNKNKVNKKISPVDRLIASFNKLSLREQRDFIKALPKNV